MAGASDKARFYLEQSVPELQELARKKIFTRDEIASIARKRSAFEHKLNARGTTASDYARYTEYEMNLESLRQKRSKRLGVKLMSYTGQRRVLSILDRATRKFHGDAGLWLQYLTFARGQKANKKVNQIITNMLRLHPTSPELWTYAADYALDEKGDVTEARSFMQRGLRFCAQSKYLWSEYLKLEMIYIAKITARRQVLGLGSTSSRITQIPDTEATDADIVTLAPITMEDIDLEHQAANLLCQSESMDDIESSPALTGAIPIAIFESAIKNSTSDTTFGAQMFGIVAEFHQLQCTRRILKRIIETLMMFTPNDAATLNCFISEPIIGLNAMSTLLPGALAQVLDRFDSTIRKVGSLDGPPESIRTRAIVSRHMIRWIFPYLDVPELDSDIRAVLIQMLKMAWDYCLSAIETGVEKDGTETIVLLEMLQVHDFKEMVQSGLASASRVWPGDERLLSLGAKEPWSRSQN
ncbi:MAG: hypothetical protein Q9170_003874 [Blastenia crenularia]